ncbi:Transcription factor spt8 [Nowakowskiella sp. JEL0078]|nr:Transcription factor spt8 [Nowakowskiella sp. JEL0078]
METGKIARNYTLSSQVTSASFQQREIGSLLMVSTFDGVVSLLDQRAPDAEVSKIPSGIPPWAVSTCWSAGGNSIFAGRRNGTNRKYLNFFNQSSFSNGVDELDIVARKVSRVIKMPRDSGPVSAVAALPNGRNLLCASTDNIRLYDLEVYSESASITKEQESLRQSSPLIETSIAPFSIVPGHHGGVISSLYLNDTAKFLVSTSGNRGWDGVSTERCIFYQIENP